MEYFWCISSGWVTNPPWNCITKGISYNTSCRWHTHLGVTKTYYKVLVHAFLSRMRKDIKNYCRSCQICQEVGKPNQKSFVLFWNLSEFFYEIFTKVTIDYVCSLRKTKAGNQYLLRIMCASTNSKKLFPFIKISREQLSMPLRILVCPNRYSLIKVQTLLFMSLNRLYGC